jgi:hypothetical protein
MPTKMEEMVGELKSAQQELFDHWYEESMKRQNRCKKHSIVNSRKGPCNVCEAREKDNLLVMRTAAEDKITIYSKIYLDPKSYSSLRHIIKSICCTIVIVMLQMVIPIGIAFQLLDHNDGEELWHTSICPRDSNNFVRSIAFILSAFFGIMTYVNCQGKLRGILFLMIFCPLKGGRIHNLIFSVLSTGLSMLVSYLVQFLIFIDAGDSSYLGLLFRSLSMQFILTADTSLVSSAQKDEAYERIKLLAADELIGILDEQAGDGNLDEQAGDGLLTKEAVSRLQMMGRLELVVISMVVASSGFLSVAVAVCI